MTAVLTLPEPSTDTRRLTTRDTVTALTPIPGADRIELASVRGWEVIVKKGEVAVGDDVIYFEVDAALPVADPRFAFLSERSVKNRRSADGTTVEQVHALKTIKLRGVYSQGLVLAASDFPELDGAPADSLDAILGVTKWEPPVKTIHGPGGRTRPGGIAFPTHVTTKTDAERVQNIRPLTWAAIQADADLWEATEKVDGTSLTVWRDRKDPDNPEAIPPLRVASRNWELRGPQRPVRKRGLVGLWQKITGSHQRALRAFREDRAHFETTNQHWIAAHCLASRVWPGEWIQGEVAGPGIACGLPNALELPDVRLFVFGYGNHGGPDGSRRLPVEEWPAWAANSRVPVYPFTLPATVKETVQQVEKLKSLIAPGKDAEGVVWTRRDGVSPAGLGRPVFKSLSAKYLLKQN